MRAVQILDTFSSQGEVILRQSLSQYRDSQFLVITLFRSCENGAYSRPQRKGSLLKLESWTFFLLRLFARQNFSYANKVVPHLLSYKYRDVVRGDIDLIKQSFHIIFNRLTVPKIALTVPKIASDVTLESKHSHDSCSPNATLVLRLG